MPSIFTLQQVVYIVTNRILLFTVGAIVDVYVLNLNPATNFNITGYLSKNFSKNTRYVFIYIGFMHIYIYIYTFHFEFIKSCI